MQKEDEKPKVKELTEEELEALYRRIEANKLTKEDADLIKNTIKFSLWIQRKFKEAGVTPHAIWHLLSHVKCVLYKTLQHQIFSFA